MNEFDPIGGITNYSEGNAKKSGGNIILNFIKAILMILGAISVVVVIIGVVEDQKYNHNSFEGNDLVLRDENIFIEKGILQLPQTYNGEPVKSVYVDCANKYDFNKIFVPEGIEDIEIAYSANIDEFIVDENNSYLSTHEGSLYDKELTTLLYYANNSKNKKFPETLKYIDYGALNDMVGYSKIEIEPEYSEELDGKITNYLKIKVN